MTNDCKTCPVSAGTHKPAEAVHQIAEPAASVEKEIQEVMILVNTVQKNRVCAEMSPSNKDHFNEIAQAAATEIVGKLRTLLSTPQPCSRSHPHEEMTPMCELRTEIARLTNALARAEAAAPQAVQAAVPEVLGWVHKTNNGKLGSKFYTYEPHCDHAVRDDGGEKIAVVAAPAHPAEGVPAQDVEIKVSAVMLKVAALIEKRVEAEPCAEAEAELLKFLRAALAATHPTQQGLDALRKALEDLERACDKRASLTSPEVYLSLAVLPGMSVALLELDVARAQARAALAAQAKQGVV